MTSLKRFGDTNKTNSSVYDGDRVVRNLTVVIDSDTVSEEDDLGVDGVLFGGLRKSSIVVQRYSDNGPDPDAETITFPHHEPMARGWISVKPHLNDLTTHAIISGVSDSGYKHQAVWNEATGHLERQLSGDGDPRSPTPPMPSCWQWSTKSDVIS